MILHHIMAIYLKPESMNKKIETGADSYVTAYRNTEFVQIGNLRQRCDTKSTIVLS